MHPLLKNVVKCVTFFKTLKLDMPHDMLEIRQNTFNGHKFLNLLRQTLVNIFNLFFVTIVDFDLNYYLLCIILNNKGNIIIGQCLVHTFN